MRHAERQERHALYMSREAYLNHLPLIPLPLQSFPSMTVQFGIHENRTNAAYLFLLVGSGGSYWDGVHLTDDPKVPPVRVIKNVAQKCMSKNNLV